MAGADNDAKHAPSVTEYHVHHNERLCVGPVLVTAISGDMTEAAQNCYSIVLKKSATDAFPIVLDYLYTGRLNILDRYGDDADFLYGHLTSVTYRQSDPFRHRTFWLIFELIFEIMSSNLRFSQIDET